MKYFSLHQQWVLYGITLLLLGSLWFSFSYHPPSPSSEELVKEVVIEVSGEVRSPGVYLFKNPPTLREAVERAGGLKESVQLDTTLPPEMLETGTLLMIGKRFSAIPPSPPHPFSFPPGERGKNEQSLSDGENKGMKNDEIRIRISRMAADKCLIFSIPLDLNRISMEDLCLIPGIGESLAQEVIAYRERRRGFRSVEDLRNVRGIGEKKYRSLKGFFTTR
jgi:competence ComEA-like helix-hairpin-helix protein